MPSVLAAICAAFSEFIGGTQPKEAYLSPDQIFFCIGCQKTGTTLLARVLDQHPRIACVWESYALRPEAAPSIYKEMKAWFAQNMPSVKVEVRSVKGSYMQDQPKLWKEIKEKGDAAMIGISG